MKKVLFLSVAALLVVTGCTTNISNYEVADVDFVNAHELINDLPTSDLSNAEIAGLVLMREEEKLARDVYMKLGEKWGMNIFSNIAQSEQTHTDAVKYLLERYVIEDPVTDDAIGSFINEDLQKIYDALLAQGSRSLLEALNVGATVEDLDINDLNNLISETDNEDIILTYENLVRGSRNHLRAFVRQIEKNGGTYEPQYISQVEYDLIIDSDQETGQDKNIEQNNSSGSGEQRGQGKNR